MLVVSPSASKEEEEEEAAAAASLEDVTACDDKTEMVASQVSIRGRQ
jgi:hypothetical protein